MSEDLIIRVLLFVVICILVIGAYKWLSLGRVCEPSPPVELDPKYFRDVAESEVISYQNSLGRERNGYTWKNKQE